jgi:hypothetical protein
MQTLVNLGFALLLLLPLPGMAQTTEGPRSPAFGWSSKRAEVRAQTRWSLEDWLKQRERMKWSDLWLQMNSPSPYEFFLSAGATLVPESVGRSRTVRYGAGAYVSIFGLEYEHQKVFEAEDHLRFHVRFFGNSLQNTSLTLHFGMRQRDDQANFNQWYAGIDSQIYLQKVFGLTAGYRYHLQSIPTALYGTPFGHRIEGGPFLDYGFLRIFAKFLAETENRSNGMVGAYGWSGGVQVYF